MRGKSYERHEDQDEPLQPTIMKQEVKVDDAEIKNKAKMPSVTIDQVLKHDNSVETL